MLIYWVFFCPPLYPTDEAVSAQPKLMWYWISTPSKCRIWRAFMYRCCPHHDTHTHTHTHTHHRWWIAFHLLLSNFSVVFQQFESAISWCGFFIFVLHGVCWASWKCKLKFSIKFGEFSHIISSDIFFFFLFSFRFSHHENVGLLDVFWGSVHFTLVVFLSVLQIK